MNRRHFLAALGIGSAEVVWMQHRVLRGSLPVFAATVSQLPDPVGFKKFDKRLSGELILRNRFKQYVNSQFPGVVAPFNSNSSMWSAAWSYTGAGSIKVDHNRFLVISGNMHHVAQDRGMIWIDAANPQGAERPPLVVMSFFTQDGEKTLWIVSNQGISNANAQQLPHHFTMTMDRWIRSRKPLSQDRGFIRKVVFYEPSALGVSPVLSNFGIKPYRTTANVQAGSMSTGAPAASAGS